MLTQIDSLYGLINSKTIHKLEAGNTNESYLIQADSGKYILRLYAFENLANEKTLALQEKIYRLCSIVSKPIVSKNIGLLKR